MIYAASKIIWALLSPLNLVAVLLLAAAGFWRFSRKVAFATAALAVFLFFIAGLTPLGYDALARLENETQRTAQTDLPKEISGIIILGGTFDANLSAARDSVTVNDSMERVMEGLRLARKYPRAITVFSGGEGGLLLRGRPESRELMRWMGQAGYDPDDFVFEEKSRNTWENVQFTMDMMNPGREDIWIVVTSAYHMPRTMMAFRALGWQGRVIPWPVDYRTDGVMRWFTPGFDVVGNAYKAGLALHEFAGMIAYGMK